MLLPIIIAIAAFALIYLWARYEVWKEENTDREHLPWDKMHIDH